MCWSKNYHYPKVITWIGWKHKKKNLIQHELIYYKRIEEANHLKDNMDALSLNSSKANLLEFACPTYRDKFTGKGKKNLSPSHPRQ